MIRSRSQLDTRWRIHEIATSTAKVYDLASAINALPSIGRPREPETQSQSLKATGTDDTDHSPADVLPICLPKGVASECTLMHNRRTR